ncbi:MAG: ComEC/Rec2 family competence protein [Terriglobales bacterium]
MWMVVLLGAAALFSLWQGRRRSAAVLGLVVCLALGYARSSAVLRHPAPKGVLVQAAWQLQQQPRRRVFVTGYLRDQPTLLYDEGQASAVRLDLQAVSLAATDTSRRIDAAHGGVRLYAYPPRKGGGPHWDTALLRLPAGAGMAVTVHLRPLRSYGDPGVPDFSAKARRQGIVATATLPLAGWQRWPMAYHHSPVAAARAHVWGWLSARLDALAPPARAPRANALLRGMLLGDVARLDETTRTDFQIDGVYHLLVVAGLHIGVLVFVLWWGLKWLRCPPVAAGLVSLVLLAGYAWVIVGRTPTLRALLMLALYEGARLWYRERQALNAVGAAALLLLLWRPLDLYRAGFAMSFGAALLLAGVALPLLLASSHQWRRACRHLDNVSRDETFSPKLAQLRLDLRRIAEDLASWWPAAGWRIWPQLLRFLIYAYDIVVISLILQVGLAGFNTVYFHRANPWSVLANAVLVPAAAILIPLAWVAVLLASAGGLATHAAGVVVSGMAKGMLGFAGWMARWPGANGRMPSPPGWFLVLCGAGAVVWLVVCTAGRRRQRLGRPVAVVSALAGVLALLLAFDPFPPRLPPGLSATILNVGQGDSIFVSFPDGRTMLVDGGPRSARWDTGQEIVAPFLWSLGLHRLGAVLLTHAHNDHLGGLSTVVTDFHPREVWVTRTLPSDAPTRAFLQQVQASHARLRRLDAGDIMRVGASQVAVLLPQPAYAAGPAPSNDDSMVVRVTYQGQSMLLEGDAEAEGEHWMVDHHLALGSALLKVGHHGSKTSSTPQFLAEVHPQAAVISVGADNSYGQPAAQVLADLRRAGARVFRTDRDGAIQCRLQGGRLRVFLFHRLPGANQAQPLFAGGSAPDASRWPAPSWPLRARPVRARPLPRAVLISLMRVRVMGQDGTGTIKLLERHQPRQLVRKREGGERKAPGSGGTHR